MSKYDYINISNTYENIYGCDQNNRLRLHKANNDLLSNIKICNLNSIISLN